MWYGFFFSGFFFSFIRSLVDPPAFSFRSVLLAPKALFTNGFPPVQLLSINKLNKLNLSAEDIHAEVGKVWC